MTKDMTTGSPLKNIIRFCLPLMVGNLFQQFYNMADTIIVGQFVGKNALSAVGSVGPLNFMIIGTVIMIPAYPIYRRIARKTKEELIPEILRLSEEIMKS